MGGREQERMNTNTAASAAYQLATTHRGWREQEADIFRRTVGALRAARGGDLMARVRALADNRRLWTGVIDVVQDPENTLPIALRAAIVSVGLAVQREIDRDSPDLEFLILVNEQLAEGLSGSA